MSIAHKPEDSKKVMLQELDNASGDQWSSLNLSKFVPPELQQAIELIDSMLTTIASAMEYAMALSRLIHKLTAATTDLITMVIKSLAESIKQILDIIPKTDTGVYLLWIPTLQGGNYHYDKTFRASIVDSADFKRPPEDEDLHLYSLFFLWGSPMYDKERAERIESKYASFNSPKEVFRIENNLKQYFGLDNKVPSWAEVPKPKDFYAKKSFFTKSKSEKDEVASLVRLPDSASLDGVDTAINYLRSSIIKITRKSEASGVMANLSWTYPRGYRGTSLENTRYGTSNQGNTKHYTKSVTQIIGIEILFSDNATDLNNAMRSVHDNVKNPLAFTDPDLYEDSEEEWGNVLLIHKKLDGMPDNTFYTQILPPVEYDADGEPIKKYYYFASAFVYTSHTSSVQVDYDSDKSYRIYDLVNGNTAGKELRSTWDTTDPKNHDLNFDSVSPRDISFRTPLPKDGVQTLVSELTTITSINSKPLIESAGGAEPNWVSLRGVQELVPELKGIVDRTKAYVDNIADSFIDDVEAFQDWIDQQLQDVNDMASEILEMTKLIQGLLFPPMAGIHYISIETHYGIHDIAKRLRKSMDSTIPNSKFTYNPALLDQDFMDANGDYINKAAAVPAYSDLHYTGGFVLVFQDPEVNKFLERIMGITNSFTDDFKKIYNDYRLKVDKPVLPTFATWEQPEHPLVAIATPNSPGDAGRNESDNKSGRNEKDSDVNANGKVDILANPGPYANEGPAGNFTITYNDDDTGTGNTGTGSSSDYDSRNDKTVTLPIGSGTFTAEELASKAAFLGHNLFKVVDRALYLEANSFSIAPCSGDFAAAMGIDPATSKKAPKQSEIELQEQPFGALDNDLIVQLETNGMPTLDMLKSTPPVWQYRAFKATNLGPSYYNIKITIEGVTREIDVTGNAGSNPVATSAKWKLATDFPLVLTDDNNKFLFDLTGAPVDAEIPTQQLLTLRESTYENYNELGAELLYALDIAGYPVGTFSTMKATDDTYTELIILKEWGYSGSVDMAVASDPSTPSQDFLTNLTASQTVPGITEVPYTITDILGQLNSAFLSDNFVEVDGGVIRIQGDSYGRGNIIKVHCGSSNSEYSIVAKDIFGFDFLQIEDLEVEGHGEPMTCFAYQIESETPVLCATLSDNGQQNMEVEIETEYFEVVIEKQENYYIEMLNQI